MPNPEYPVPYSDVSQALVRRQAPEPTFSAAQQRALQELALSYLQRSKLPFDRDILRAAVAILTVDCLPRGLAVLGLPELGPKENVRRVIRAGLDHRAYAATTANEALRSDEPDISRMEGTYVGAYAFEKKLTTRAQANLARFAITPDITACDTLAYQYNVRKQLLPVFAATALGALPKEQFPQASLATFPGASQQAKLVRNSLLSLAARGIPFPALAIDDLRVMLLDPELTVKLEPKILESFFQHIGNPSIQSSDEAQAYGQALLTQIREAVVRVGKPASAHPEGESELIALRDQLYRSFNSVFLLLHPAIEETKLITDPAKVEEGDYSLWRSDLSVVIDGLRVPNVEALLRAERLTQARGYSSERFGAAIQAWRHLESSTREEQERLERLKKGIKAQSAKISHVRAGTEDLPPRAFDLVATYHIGIHDRYMAARSRLHDHEADIKENNEARAAAEDYYHAVLQANGSLPDRMPIPEIALQKTEGSDFLSRRHKSIYYRRQKEALFTALAEDYWEQNAARSMQYEEWMSLDSEGIFQEIEKRSQADNRPKEIPLDDVREYVEDYLPVVRARRIRGMRTMKSREVTPRLPGDQERYEQLRDINLLFIQCDKADAHSRPVLERKIQSAFGTFVVRNGLMIYQAALDLEQRRVTEIEGPAIQPSRTEWSRREMMAWYKEMLASTLPDRLIGSRYLQSDMDEINNWLHQFDRLKAYGKGTLFPQTISNRAILEGYINAKVTELSAEIPQVLPEKVSQRLKVLVKTSRIQDHIGILERFSAILGNSLLPFQEGDGLAKQDFFHAVRERIGIARAVVSLPKDQEAHLEAAHRYNEVALDSYVKSLQAQLQRMQVELAEIIVNEPAKNKFLQAMGSLRLIKVEQEGESEPILFSNE